MTLDGVYTRIASSTKSPHWLPHFVLDILLIQEIAYHTYVNGVVASLHRKKKGLWPLFPLSTKVCKIENFKQTKDKVGIFTSFKFKEVSFRRHYPQEKLKEHLQHVVFIWSDAHEDLLPGEMSQQQVLVKSKIPTLDQMFQIDKEVEIQKSKSEKIKVVIEQRNLIRIEDEE